jgi:hypothetical protein
MIAPLPLVQRHSKQTAGRFMESKMPAYETNLKTMLAIWNTSDPDKRRAMAQSALEHNVHFVDPRHNIIGREAFHAMVEATHAAFPGAVYRPNSMIEMQNNFCRYHWAIERVTSG